MPGQTRVHSFVEGFPAPVKEAWQDFTKQASRVPKLLEKLKDVDNVIKLAVANVTLGELIAIKHDAEKAADVFHKAGEAFRTARAVTGLVNGPNALKKSWEAGKHTVILIAGLFESFEITIVTKWDKYGKPSQIRQYDGTVEKVIGVFRCATEGAYHIVFMGTFTVVSPIAFFVRIYSEAGPTARKVAKQFTLCLLIADSCKFASASLDLTHGVFRYLKKVHAGEDTDEDFEELMEAINSDIYPLLSKGCKIVSGSLTLAKKAPIAGSVINVVSATIDLASSWKETAA